ncbi:probable RNA-binding protein EIF1AD [Euwallacea fornicatus]|uniref:probable RNA-binding protein EIF1AD n=1 Tax=Euwallacea fornicatus TaxID=995702 RepID=UPI00338FEC4D
MASKKNKCKNIYHTDEFFLPEHHQVVRILRNKGNYVYQAQASHGCTFLVSTSPKFRRSLWIKTGSYVLVQPIKNHNQAKGEIVQICTPKLIRHLMHANLWPKEFEVAGYRKSRVPKTKNDYICINTNNPKDESGSFDDSGFDISFGSEFDNSDESESDSMEMVNLIVQMVVTLMIQMAVTQIVQMKMNLMVQVVLNLIVQMALNLIFQIKVSV